MAVETNGHINGILIESSPPSKKGRHTSLRSTKPSNPQQSWTGHIFSVIARIATWYLIVTVLFRCPSSPTDLTDASPKVCRTYLTIRSHVSPYLEPYYDTYAIPYVNTVRPYVEKFNRQVITPAATFGKHSYEAYGAPRVEKARQYGLKEWEATIKPQLEVTTDKARKQYNSTLGPYVSRLNTLSEPYYRLARDNFLQTYYAHLLPAYTTFVPYLQSAYAHSHKFAIETGIPYAQWAYEGLAVFVNRTLWPKVRVLYGENVEPQLVRIGERLGRYRDGKKLRAVVSGVDSSTKLSSSSILSPISSSVTAAYATTLAEEPTAPPSLEPSTESDGLSNEEQEVQKVVQEDLRVWQEKFAKAADKGAEDLEERVQEITDKQINHQAHGVGQALVIQLEETVKSELRRLKQAIVDIVKALPSEEDEGDIENAHGGLYGAIRTAGLAIRDKAVALRTWRQSYIVETDSLVRVATDSTLDVIDNIRDLGLQEVGMRWAWMEGVTYKDWSRYHGLKKTFDEWRKEVEAVAGQHEGLRRAHEAGEEVENRGMIVAEEAAIELARLKEVGKWKIDAKDSSDDFSTKHIPAAVVRAGQEVLKKAKSASEAVAGTAQGMAESIATKVSDTIAEAASEVSEAVLGTTQGTVESVSSIVSRKVAEASSKVSEAVVEVSEAVLGTDPGVPENAATKASETLIGLEQPKSELVISTASKKAEYLASEASEALMGTPVAAREPEASVIAENVSSAATAAVESTPAELNDIVNTTGGTASEATQAAKDNVEDMASQVSSAAASATQKVRDEL